MSNMNYYLNPEAPLIFTCDANKFCHKHAVAMVMTSDRGDPVYSYDFVCQLHKEKAVARGLVVKDL